MRNIWSCASPVDEDVEAPQLFDGLLDGALHIFFLRQIRHNGHSMLQLA